MLSSLNRIALVCALMAAAPGCFAQSAGPASSTPGQSADSPQLSVRELHPKTAPTPFPVNARTKSRQELEFRPVEQMTAADRELAEANEAEIARRAGLQGFRGVGGVGQAEMEPSKDDGWGYEQAVCPVFPGHLILEYSRGNGDGDVTLFAAVVPRGEGHVRVIPVRRRGYSLWTPASSNALTINDFNHMVQEGHEGLSPDWLTLGLCYTALAGGHVRAALAARTAEEEVYPLVAPAMLTVGAKGGAEVRLDDATPKTKPMSWTLSFDGRGRLLKVRHTGAPELVEKPVRGAPMEVHGVPVHGSVIEATKPENRGPGN